MTSWQRRTVWVALFGYMRVSSPIRQFKARVWTHEEGFEEWKVDDSQAPERTALLGDRDLKHLLVCAKQFIRLILDSVELVVEA